MTGWERRLDGILISDPALARADGQVAAALGQLQADGWNVHVLAGSEVRVTIERDGVVHVVRDATTRQALATAWEAAHG